MLESFNSSSLRHLDVAISGEWHMGTYRDWRGEARAWEPIVAVAFSQSAGIVSWCKSERPHPSAQAVRLLLGPHDASHRDVQVNFSIGDGHVIARTEVDSPSYCPPLPSTLRAGTGELVEIVSVHGSLRVGATLVVSRWEKEIDGEALRKNLAALT